MASITIRNAAPFVSLEGTQVDVATGNFRGVTRMRPLWAVPSNAMPTLGMPATVPRA